VKQLLAARRKKIFLVLLSAFVSWILILYFFMPLCLSVL
jgi:antibiotic biosynthesis monooxygenase (ABM) superfamily enzyme